jgi:hypothetical protein
LEIRDKKMWLPKGISAAASFFAGSDKIGGTRMQRFYLAFAKEEIK